MVGALAGSGSARMGSTRLEADESAGKQAGLRATTMSSLGGPAHQVAIPSTVPQGLRLWHDDTLRSGGPASAVN